VAALDESQSVTRETRAPLADLAAELLFLVYPLPPHGFHAASACILGMLS